MSEMTAEQRERKRAADRARRRRQRAADPEGVRQAERERKRRITPEARERHRQRDTERRRAARAAAGGWLLPDDGVFDELAVEIAVSGRRVRLTRAERAEAVRRCLEVLGLSRAETAARLHIDRGAVARAAARPAADEQLTAAAA